MLRILFLEMEKKDRFFIRYRYLCYGIICGCLFAFLTACNTTKAVVRNGEETTISIRTTNSNSVRIDPRTDSLSVKVNTPK